MKKLILILITSLLLLAACDNSTTKTGDTTQSGETNQPEETASYIGNWIIEFPNDETSVPGAVETGSSEIFITGTSYESKSYRLITVEDSAEGESYIAHFAELHNGTILTKGINKLITYGEKASLVDNNNDTITLTTTHIYETDSYIEAGPDHMDWSTDTYSYELLNNGSLRLISLSDPTINSVFTRVN